MPPVVRRLPPPVPPEALRGRAPVTDLAEDALEIDLPTRAVPPPPPPEALQRLASSVLHATPPPVPAAARLRRRTASAPSHEPVAAEEPRDLVDAARGGDVRAFNALVQRYRPRILALALHLTGSANDADDIAQDVFLKAFQRVGDFEGRSAFFTWIYRIALNRSLQVIQQRRVRQGVDLDDPRVALAVAVDAGGAPATGARAPRDLRPPRLRLRPPLPAPAHHGGAHHAPGPQPPRGRRGAQHHRGDHRVAHARGPRAAPTRALDAAAADADVVRTHSPEATATATRRSVSGTQRVSRRQRDSEPDAMSCSLAIALASVVSA